MEAKVLSAIYEAVDELNQQRGPDQQVAKSPETVLLGEGGCLDSLALVTLVVGSEQKIQDAFGVGITLADERAMSQRNSPFRSIQALAAYAESLVKEQTHG